MSTRTAPPHLGFQLAHDPDYPPPTYVTRIGFAGSRDRVFQGRVRRGWSTPRGKLVQASEGCSRDRGGELGEQLEAGDVLRANEAEMASVKGADAGCAKSLSDGDKAAIDAAEVLIGVLNGERCDSSPIGCR